MQELYLILAIAFYYFMHSVLAASSVKNQLYSFISPPYYRLFFNAMAVLLLAPIVFIYIQNPKTFVFAPTALSHGMGLLFLAIAALLLFVALSQYNLGEFLGSKYLDPQKSKAPVQLQISGFNGLVRHPLYFATLIFVWAWFLKRATLADLIIAIATSLYLIIGIHFEEKKLLAEFGNDYLAYQKKVKKLIPFIF